MKSVLRTLGKVAAARSLAPLVIGFFFLLYLAIAFTTDETLVTLMEVTRRSLLLTLLLALVPLNCAARLAAEVGRHLRRRRALRGDAAAAEARLFDEAVVMPDSPRFAELAERLAPLGYRVSSSEGNLAAWRGWCSVPSRILFLAGSFCLFTGIVVSLTARDSQRVPLIEGEQFTAVAGAPGVVERITLAKASGPLLEKTLSLQVASAQGEGRRVMGLYPPALLGGAFIYPRYLGIAPQIRFSAPDLPNGYEAFCVINIFPAGKEDSVEIPGTPYRITMSIKEPEAGNEVYVTGRMTFQFKLMRGKELLFADSAPLGGQSVHNGYRVAFSDYRRVVFTDFIRDYGVLLIWGAFFLFLLAILYWLPVRLFLPRREMLFVREKNQIRGYALASGGRRTHAGVFQEALDLLEVKAPSTQ